MPTTGYTSTTSVAPGGRVDFHLSATPPGPVRLVVQRFDTAGGSIDVTVPVATHAAPPPTTIAHSWPVAHSLVVPADWPTGLYVLKARGPGDAALVDVTDFVVRPSSPGATSRVLLATDFITPQAYNSAGGRSLYAPTRVSKVSFNRPTPPDLDGSRRIIPWLRVNGFTVEHASLVDLHTMPALLANYDCLLFVHHAEYWSREMRDQVERFIRNGGNVVSLSGNTCYRQVRFENANRTLVGFKDAAADPATDLSTTSVAFAQPPVNRPPNAMLGVGWTYGAWGGSAAEYRVHFPGHWTMAGASLTDGCTPKFMSYETDAAPFVIEAEGHPRVTADEGTPLSTVVLASADLGRWDGKPGMATATLFVRGGMVFAAGTTEWVLNLDDGAIGPITRNVLTRLRARRTFDWEAIGHANHVVAMTALEGRLYAATSDNNLWQRHPVLADARWRDIGHANDITAMAADRGTLFVIRSDNSLNWREPVDREVVWTRCGSGPPGGTRALSAAGGVLYAVAGDGLLYYRPATRAAVAVTESEPEWKRGGGPPAATHIVAMTSYNGILLAATSTNRLVRTGFDFVRESTAWVDLLHCNGARGLAVVDNMLFVATTGNRLWWLDLHHPALDALSRER
jgi:hypothetical protein